MSDDLITIKIDGEAVSVPNGTVIIRAAEQLGIHIPRFCDHPLLDPAGACRQCLVEVAIPGRDGVVAPMPKPQSACTMTVMPGMEVKTQRTSEVAEKAQQGVLEFMLANHPLDCPICDKGGECPLQNQVMSHGSLATRHTDSKRVWPKPVALSETLLLDRERCILCQRCIRFADQIAGDDFIQLQGRGGGSAPDADHYFMGGSIGTFDADVLGIKRMDDGEVALNSRLSNAEGEPAPVSSRAAGPVSAEEQTVTGGLFTSYFAGNTIQICPVGALTSATYRFRGRPFDLASVPGVTEQDASGAAIRTDIRRGEVVRRMAATDMDVNEEWISDKDRYGYTWTTSRRRITDPMVRRDGNLVPVSWSEAIAVAAEGLRRAANDNGVGLLPGGRLPFEDAWAWSKFARVTMGTNDIDQRVRSIGGAEEDSFLARFVAGTGMAVTYTDVETAGGALLVGLEPEDECATLFLRMRKGVHRGTLQVDTVASFLSDGCRKLSARLLPAAPGTEPEVVAAADGEYGVILVGERAAAVPGLLSAVVDLAARNDARIAWVPRRPGERGGLEAGLVPNLLPFGRQVGDPDSRVDVAAAWGTELPEQPGRDANAILDAAARGELTGLVFGGVDDRDFPNREALRAAVRGVEFVVSLEFAASSITERADVVLPVVPITEKPGTFINWEGRLRPFGQVLVTSGLTDREVLDALSERLSAPIKLPKLADVHADANALMGWNGARAAFTRQDAAQPPSIGENQAVLSTYKPLLDNGLLQEDAEELACNQRYPIARMNPADCEKLGANVEVSTEKGAIHLPLVPTESMARHVIWIPQCSAGSHVYETLQVSAGAVVGVAASTEVER